MHDGRLLIANAEIVKRRISLAYGKLTSLQRRDFRPGVGLLLVDGGSDANTVHLTEQQRRTRIGVIGGLLKVRLCLVEVGATSMFCSPAFL